MGTGRLTRKNWGFLEVFPDKFRKWIYKPNAEAMGRGIILAPWPRLFFRFSVGPEGVGKPPWPGLFLWVGEVGKGAVFVSEGMEMSHQQKQV